MPNNGAWRLAVSVTLLASVLFASEAATREPPELRTASRSSTTRPDSKQLEGIVGRAYPTLLTQKIAGTPIVTVLLNADGSTAGTRLEIAPSPVKIPDASEAQFAGFGLKSGELQYIGIATIQLPLNTVLVVFGGRDSSASR